MLVLNYQHDLTEFKEAVMQYCTARINYLEGDECSINESVEGFEEVDFLETLRLFVDRYGKPPGVRRMEMKLFTDVQYEDMQPVKAIELGDGSVSIMDLRLDGVGRAGIAFKKREFGEVGKDSGDGGKMLNKVKPDFIILTDNVDSLRVLLDKVERAIKHLVARGES